MEKKILQKRVKELEGFKAFIQESLASLPSDEELVKSIELKVAENEDLKVEFKGEEKLFDEYKDYTELLHQVSVLFDYVCYRIKVYNRLLEKEN